MLQLTDLGYAYDKVPVLNQLTIELPAGQIHGIAGLNGAGKTTLMRLLMGQHSARQDSMLWQGQTLQPQQVAYLQTDPFFYPRITGMEYLRLFKARHPQFAIEQWNELFGLPLNELVDEYSSGMRKKLAFIGLLAYNTPILLLDEPFNNLDIETNTVVARILNRLARQGKTIVLTSHILEALTSLCHTIGYLRDGHITHHYNSHQFDALKAAITNTVAERTGHLIDTLTSQPAVKNNP